MALEFDMYTAKILLCDRKKICGFIKEQFLKFIILHFTCKLLLVVFGIFRTFRRT